MKEKRTRLLIVSYDAVGERVVDKLLALPETGAFLREAALARNAKTVFVSNTYPIHTAVVTGRVPGEHGLTSNTPAFPARYHEWNFRTSLIKAKTLWQAFKEKGLTQATVLWPVTGKSREINWNLPEIMPRPVDNMVTLHFKNGTGGMLLRLFLKYRHILQGISQPARDRFGAACMADILRRHKPDVAFMHFTAYDTQCHHFGEGSPEAEEALQVMDAAFGDLIRAATSPSGEKPSVILFSDHAQLPASRVITPNDWLVEMELLSKAPAEAPNGALYQVGESGCFIECCGGSAFLHPGALKDASIRMIRERIEASEGFNRWLREDEMTESGYAIPGSGICGWAAQPGYQYAPMPVPEIWQHGFPTDYPDYGVFYAVQGPDVAGGQLLQGGSLLDIAPIALRIMGAKIEGLRPVRDGIFRG